MISQTQTPETQHKQNSISPKLRSFSDIRIPRKIRLFIPAGRSDWLTSGTFKDVDCPHHLNLSLLPCTVHRRRRRAPRGRSWCRQSPSSCAGSRTAHRAAGSSAHTGWEPSGREPSCGTGTAGSETQQGHQGQAGSETQQGHQGQRRIRDSAGS